ncbi:MAG TPA: isoprenylcysteine carboxylmethyltransferase family protein [Firmicutes bacterium]|jgi:protein-S-isoprenylcysteine O-methyltransferase Ste14|nr:isoprenylcysteine carboxylmethyltransferase family protein [Bacillota bacterium]HOQ25072.1 isoprenylcysteine carboxylmethyltransferase family protein [Bacillota bacterium]HPT68421.1 isoprenylcysteine carboxylmethyltransferase family protein [Bacillota bacterium]
MAPKKRSYLRNIISPTLMLVLVLLLHHRFPYKQGLVFIVINCIWIIFTHCLQQPLAPKNPVQSVARPAKDWERRYFILATLLENLILLVTVADAAFRSWYPALTWSFTWTGIALFTAGHLLFYHARRSNPFFYPVFQVEPEQGHVPCSSGPYRLIRHPGYLGGALFHLSTPLILGSFWGLLPALAFVLVLGRKTYLEDMALRKELPGYTSYAETVRYRWFPGLW